MKKILIVSESTPDGFTFMVGQAFLWELKTLNKFHALTIIAPFVLPWPRSKINIQILKMIFKIKKRGFIHNVAYYRPWFFGLPFKFSILNDFLKVLAILICIKSNNIKFDAIHAYYGHPPGFVAVLLGKITNKPVIISCLGSDVHEYAQEKYPDKLRRKRVLYALKNANYLITVCNFLKDKIISLGIPEAKIEVIPCGVRQEVFYSMNKTSVRQKLKLPLNKTIILNVGFLIPVKGTDFLIDAFAEIITKRNDLVLLIIGHGPMRSQLEEKVKSLCLSEYVRFLGFVSEPDIGFWFNASDLFVLPSLMEGFAIVIVEALACGLPVVASAIGGITEKINKSDFGILVPPGKVKELSEAILQALDRTWDKNKLIETSKYYAWGNAANLKNKVYERTPFFVKSEELVN